jgi:hypothetical protein
MKKGLRSFLFGMHNPILHGFLVYLAWKKIFHKYPNAKETICILFHDVGYIKQDFLDGLEDNHPELGAKICDKLFGEEYKNLCLGHSRDYARKHNLGFSKLGYADKYSVLLLPNWLYHYVIYAGGEAQEYNRTTKTKKWGLPIDVKLIKADYEKWWETNGIKFDEAKI